MPDVKDITGPFGGTLKPEVKEMKMPDTPAVMAGVPVNTEQRFNAVISFVLTERDSNKHWFSAELKYSDLPYALAVGLEREGVSLADRLTSYGEAAVAVKKA